MVCCAYANLFFNIHIFISLYAQLKKDYLQVKTLRDSSGFGWDDESQLVTATDEVWITFLEVMSYDSYNL